jgi:lysyl-tRNA synthetase class 2
LEEQVRQHNEKRAAAAMETNCAEGKINKDEDGSYEVTLDDDFLTALEYGMPPASGMVWSSFCYFSLSLSLYIYIYILVA